MTCETFTTNINEHEYAYTQLPATKSLKLKYKLIGIIGGSVLEMQQAIGAEDDMQLKVFSHVVKEIFSQADPDELVNLISDVFIPCFRDKERVDIDRDFTGNTVEMYKAFSWILEMEYRDFFEELQAMLG